MALSQYDWDDGTPAIIQQHSVAKHEVLREYLVAYLKTLVVSPAQDVMKVTLIDGFAGGGVYVHEDTSATILGSPFVFLEATDEAKALIASGRNKPIQWDLDYFFVEKSKAAHQFLAGALSERGYGARVGKDIHLIHGTFEKNLDPIMKFVRSKSPRIGRSIFLLDQYGYSQVPTSQIKSIFHNFSKAEVILTFAVDSFINYASDSRATQNTLRKIDLPDIFKGRSFEEIKRDERDVRLYIQSCMYRGLVDSCGAKYYTVFFIRTTGHGDYWLVHMSQHPRARDVMTTVHWNHNNHFIHYGGAGLEMFRALGYQTKNDSLFTGQNDLGFCFDADAESASVNALVEQIAPLVHASHEDITFGELYEMTCNSSPADGAKYRAALEQLVSHKEIEVVGPDGARRLRASTIGDKDVLRIAQQRIFSF